MKYKLINEDIKNKNLLDIVYENRNITSDMVEKLLGANNEDYRNPFEIFGIDKGIKQFKEEISKNNNILIISDSDVDGVCSSCIFYNFLIDDLKYDKEKVFFHIHTGKQHGITESVFNNIERHNIKYLIVPDAGTNNLKEMKRLEEQNVKMLCLDHHQCEIDVNELPSNVSLINNQIGNKISQYASGTLVTAKFIEAYGYKIDKYYDSIAVSLIADSMNLLDEENRGYVNMGLKNIKNPLIKAYFSKNKINNPIINDVSYNLANYINALIRVGNQEEKKIMLKAFIGENEVFDYEKRTGEVIKETLQERVVRISNNCKSKQNNAVKKSVEKCNAYINRLHLDKNKVIIIKNDENFIDHSQTGLIAMKVADSWKRPCIILNKFNDEIYSGSMRSVGLDNFKEILEKTNLFDWVKGHANASGINIKKENVELLNEKLNELLKDFEVTDGRIYQVDNIIEINNLNKVDIKNIANLKPLWCLDIKEPLFVIKGIEVESANIKMVSKLKCEFKVNNVSFVKNWCSKDFYEKLTLKEQLKFGRSHPLKIDVVCKFSLDKYGKAIVEIVDFKSIKNTSKKIIF